MKGQAMVEYLVVAVAMVFVLLEWQFVQAEVFGYWMRVVTFLASPVP